LKLAMEGLGTLALPVAPCAGAWIETEYYEEYIIGTEASPPARGRGLKHYATSLNNIFPLVAPCAGAWIETGLCLLHWTGLRTSPPARGRGLKHLPDRGVFTDF